ncbi:MAG: flagellar assembly protein FliW [Spirochaetaceae bacterium]|nr:flagellar assembly protein FliW [Spirochaetaceae bacterium]
MKIETKTMGIVEIRDTQIITMPEGFYGFENFTQFALLDSEQPPFFWMQSMEDKTLAFIVIDPFLFRPDYELDIDDNTLSKIEASSPENILVFALVTIPQDGSPITANLQGPLVINKQNKKGLQVVVAGEQWKTKHDIIAEMNVHRKVD